MNVRMNVSTTVATENHSTSFTFQGGDDQSPDVSFINRIKIILASFTFTYEFAVHQVHEPVEFTHEPR